jgi:serine/threonine-protein kinase
VPDEAATPEPQRPAGKTFGRYERLEEMPRSGMGVVYKARDPVLKIDVALKTMQAAPGEERPELAERFDREAQALALLDHPHIVRIYDTGRHGGQAYFTMGFMTGGSLDRRLDRFRDPRAAAALVEKVARAMHYVHERGILHRDLKPGNILLDERGEPRVTDFGLAKFRDSELELTRPGAVLGTLPYMAPEQASGQLDRIGPATDIWALGVILYELLTGRRPFEGKMREAVASLICTAEPPKPRGLRPGLDRALETVALKCLEKRPEDRYRSAGELADDLGLWLSGESIRA